VNLACTPNFTTQDRKLIFSFHNFLLSEALVITSFEVISS
jgi:hypothetical protein